MRQQSRQPPYKHIGATLVGILALIFAMNIVSSLFSDFTPFSITIIFVGASAMAIASFVQYQYTTVPRVIQKQSKKDKTVNYQEFFEIYKQQERTFKERVLEGEQPKVDDEWIVQGIDDTIPKTSLSLFSQEVEDKLAGMQENGTLEPEIYDEVLAYLKVLPPEQRIQFLESNLFADFHLDGEVEGDED